MDDLTHLLNQTGIDGKVAADQLLPLVYQKLRQVAAEKMARESHGHTLQATALVHEAWLRVGGESQSWANRWHFFSAAAEAMRRILIDRARSKQAARHGGGLERLNVDELEIHAPAGEAEIFDVHEALDQLACRHPQKAVLVKLRYFAGLTLPEAAVVMGISDSTAKRHWEIARIWLFREIRKKRTLPLRPAIFKNHGDLIFSILHQSTKTLRYLSAMFRGHQRTIAAERKEERLTLPGGMRLDKL